MKAKIFGSRNGFQILEEMLNEWLQENRNIEIVSVSYIDNNSYASVLIIYK